MHVHQQVQAVRAGAEPALVCQVSSGWVVLAGLQYLSGYCLLLPDPVVGSLNELNREQRAEYLCDMTMVGDALLEVASAYRINYAIMGNSDPALHAHIVPRYLDEPENIRCGPPWSYTQEFMEARRFDLERDYELQQRLAAAIRQRA